MVRLSELVERLGGARAPGREDPELSDVHIDSRRVGKGTLFAALPGTETDGARFAADALGRGAAAVLAPRDLRGELENAQAFESWVHPEARRVAGEAAALVHGRPAAELSVVGVTGTNGKTTTTHLIAQLLEQAGRRPALIGTIQFELWGSEAVPATHTTPDATELQRLCRRQRELGGDSFVLEVSSHALDQERIAGLELDVAVYTNLTRDHLDYHGDMDAYAAAKERIFDYLSPSGTAVVNADDERADRMIAAARRRGVRVVTYGLGSRADLNASRLDVGPPGTHLFLEGMGIPWTGLFLPLVGRHNVENALAATAAVLSLGASPSRALEGLAAVSAPRGRMEPVELKTRGLRVFVDYAHTPDALGHALTTLRELWAEEDPADEGRLICVFGCGGDRDREKRRPMGGVVAELADVAVVTSDNPRSEDPEKIIDQILEGMRDGRAEVVVEPDRRAAIRQALRIAERGDVVLIAGKGHEAWQRLRGREIPFDDRQVVLEEQP